MSKYDVIVIGSGIGGMTAALACARAGREVLVLEASAHPGGFICPFRRMGYDFDVGIHYLGRCGPGQILHRHFERLGLLDELRFTEILPDGFDRYVFPDYEVRMCRGVERWRERLTRDFPREATGLERLFALIGRLGETIRALTEVVGLRSALRLAPRLPLLARYHGATWTQVLEAHLRDPVLKAALSAIVGDVGMAPSRVSALVVIGLVDHFLEGAWFPVGGCRAVRDAFVKGMDRAGVQLRCRSPVAKIRVEGGKVRGVRTVDGQAHDAPVVISNADVQRTLSELLGPEILPWRLRRRSGNLRSSLGSFCVFVGTDLQPDPARIDAANVWHYESLDVDAAYAPALGGVQADDPYFFLTVPTLKDPTSDLAPAGHHTVEIMTMVPYAPWARWADQPSRRRDSEYQERKERLAHRLVARAEKYLPGLSGHLRVMEVSTPLTNVSFIHTAGGGIFGPEHSPDQFGLHRFLPRSPIPGLFLCGSGVFSAGIGSVVASGWGAANGALGRAVP